MLKCNIKINMPAYPVNKIFDIIKKLELDVEIIYIGINIPHKEKIEIPDHSGVYVLVNKSRERYIGSAIDILNRQNDHHIAENIETIDVYLIESILVARKLEEILIFVLKPELNTHGKCSSDDEELRYRLAKEHLCHKKLFLYALKSDFPLEDSVINGAIW